MNARRAERPADYPDQATVDRQIKAISPGGERITGPHDIAVIEQLRDEAFGTERQPSGLPTDVFVFSRGEPVNRAVTKVGGVPYRSRDRKWPISDSGQPLTFIAQICFLDSLDIVGSLPGDILLMFGEYDAIIENSTNGIVFEWERVSDKNLVESDDVPPSDWYINPCYGHIYRTIDYPEVGKRLEQYHSGYLIDILEGTKIGGVPRWIQYPEPLPGRFLCTLGSIDPQPYTGRRFPFINVEHPAAIDDDRYLQWADVGSVYISIDANQDLFWTCQYY